MAILDLVRDQHVVDLGQRRQLDLLRGRELAGRQRRVRDAAILQRQDRDVDVPELDEACRVRRQVRIGLHERMDAERALRCGGGAELRQDREPMIDVAHHRSPLRRAVRSP